MNHPCSGLESLLDDTRFWTPTGQTVSHSKLSLAGLDTFSNIVAFRWFAVAVLVGFGTSFFILFPLGSSWCRISLTFEKVPSSSIWFVSYPKVLLAGTHIRLRGGDLKALLR